MDTIATNKLATAVAEKFREAFNSEPLIIRSPGRVNIIGEHTDYNEGFVLPAAIDKAIYVAVGKNADDHIRLYSVDYKESFEVRLSEIKPVDSWATYILGVADQLTKRGYSIGGFNLVLDGDVPLGAGLSSSAALECATVFALNELFGLGIGKLEMVTIAQKAEQTFSGVMCGIMDMFASMHGKKGNAIRLDCRSLEYEYVPLELEGYKLVLINTNVKHALSSSAYNERRQQCEQGVAWIQEHIPAIKSLRDVTPIMLQEYLLPKDKLIYTRCKYVVEENMRLLLGCEDLKNGNLAGLGKKMFATHEGLSKEYEVSCKELDILIDLVRGNTSVLGARMMGGGFGGCTINLVKEEAIEQLVNEISIAYKMQAGLNCDHYVVSVENGTIELNA